MYLGKIEKRPWNTAEERSGRGLKLTVFPRLEGKYMFNNETSLNSVETRHVPVQS